MAVTIDGAGEITGVPNSNAYGDFAVTAGFTTTTGNYVIPFTATRSARGISLSGNAFTFDEAGVYLVMVSLRPGTASTDLWQCLDVHSVATGSICVSAGFGNTATVVPVMQTIPMIAVITDTSAAYRIRWNRDTNTVSSSTPSTVGGVTADAAKAHIVRIG